MTWARSLQPGDEQWMPSGQKPAGSSRGAMSKMRMPGYLVALAWASAWFQSTMLAFD